MQACTCHPAAATLSRCSRLWEQRYLMLPLTFDKTLRQKWHGGATVFSKRQPKVVPAFGITSPCTPKYIIHQSLEDALGVLLSGVCELERSRLLADDALDLPVQLGAIMPLPLAVAARYARVASGKPEYFTTDLTCTLLASVVHKDLCVRPLLEDGSILIAPRYWCTPTADTSVIHLAVQSYRSGEFRLVPRVEVR